MSTTQPPKMRLTMRPEPDDSVVESKQNSGRLRKVPGKVVSFWRSGGASRDTAISHVPGGSGSPTNRSLPIAEQYASNVRPPREGDEAQHNRIPNPKTTAVNSAITSMHLPSVFSESVNAQPTAHSTSIPRRSLGSGNLGPSDPSSGANFQTSTHIQKVLPSKPNEAPFHSETTQSHATCNLQQSGTNGQHVEAAEQLERETNAAIEEQYRKQRIPRVDTFPGQHPISQTSNPSGESEVHSGALTLRQEDKLKQLEGTAVSQNERLKLLDEKCIRQENVIAQQKQDLEIYAAQIKRDREKAAEDRKMLRKELQGKLDDKLASNLQLVEQLKGSVIMKDQAISNSNQELVELRQQLEDANKANDRLNADLVVADRVVENLRYDLGQQHPESHLRETFQKLKTQVAKWAAVYYRGKRWRSNESKQIHCYLEAQAVESWAYFENDDMRAKLIESYIWRVLLVEVFGTVVHGSERRGNRGALWAGEYQKGVAGLNAYFRPREIPHSATVEQQQPRLQLDERKWLEYHRWRAMTAKLAIQEGETRELELRLQYLTSPIWYVLESCLSEQRFKIPPSDNDIKQVKQDCIVGLEDIIIAAMKLDRDMQSQLAFYQFKAEPRGWESPDFQDFRFDDTWMREDDRMREEAEHPLKTGDEVGMLIRPALFVSGDANGDGLCDEPTCVEHAVVAPVELPVSRRVKEGLMTSIFGHRQREGRYQR